MNIGLIVAAGRGQRAGGPIPKQYQTLGGIPILRLSAAALLRHKAIHAVQIVIHPEDRALYDQAMRGLALLPPVPGGASRGDSARLGLEHILALDPENVLIHDAVRPFVEQGTITAVLDALNRVPCAIAGIPLADTLKRCENNRVTATIDRANLWRAQTPQGFRYRDILAAHRQAEAATPGDFTDDAMVAEYAGLATEMVPGTEDNFKITTPADFARGEALLKRVN